MKYTDYGLPTTTNRQSGNRKGKPSPKVCLFCYRNITDGNEVAINACFVNFCFCESCLKAAAGPIGEHHKLSPNPADLDQPWICYSCSDSTGQCYPDSPVWRWYGFKPLAEEHGYSIDGMCQAHAQEHLRILEKNTGRGMYHILPSGQAKRPESIEIYGAKGKQLCILLAEDKNQWSAGHVIRIRKNTELQLPLFNPDKPKYLCRPQAIQAEAHLLLQKLPTNDPETNPIRKALLHFLHPQKQLF